MSFYANILFIILCCSIISADDDDVNYIFKSREERECPTPDISALPKKKTEPFYRKTVFESMLCLMLCILLGLLLLLLLLGIIKGLIGLMCYRPIGEFGLYLLIDLPKPLDRYQEKELESKPLVYDIAGWPVHPETGERSVQVLPKNIQFCLNVVFFLAYPLALMVQLCGLCCCIKNNVQYDDTVFFKEVNVIKLSKCPIKNKKTKGPKVDKYTDEDPKEAEDTKYVMDVYRSNSAAKTSTKQSVSLKEPPKERKKSNHESFQYLDDDENGFEDAHNGLPADPAINSTDEVRTTDDES